jgi:hypothetical protein
MHFGSRFAAWNCTDNKFLWDYMIAGFMSEHEAIPGEEALPTTLASATPKKLSSDTKRA